MNEMAMATSAITNAAALARGSITVAKFTTRVGGVLGILGGTTITTVTLPVAGVVATAGLVGYGVYKGVEFARKQS